MSPINNFTLKIPSFSLSFYFSKGKARDIAYSFCFRQIEIKIPFGDPSFFNSLHFLHEANYRAAC